MARYRRVDVKVWRDRFFLSLGGDAQHLWLYLITSPQTTSCGIYTLSPDVTCRDLGWTRERFDERFQELLLKGGDQAIRWDPEGLVVFLPNWLRYNPPANPNTLKSYVPVLESIPDSSPLKSAWYRTAQRLIERLRKPLAKPFRELFAELQDQDQEGGVGVGTVPTPPDGLSLDLAIWREYVQRFEDHEGIFPGYSDQYKDEDLSKLVQQAKSINRTRGVRPTDADILALVCTLLDRYFASKDVRVIGEGKYRYSLGNFKNNFASLLDAQRRDRRRST